MPNVFDATFDADNNIQVNNFDWSHQNNFTGQFGYLYPVFCELLPPKSSIRIKPTFGLQFMPMVFPVQTRMKARLSFYRVPLRTLWKDYKDYIGNFRKDLEEPYLDLKSSFGDIIGVGKLGDYLNIPVSMKGSYVPSRKVSLPLTVQNACFIDADAQFFPTSENLVQLDYYKGKRMALVSGVTGTGRVPNVLVLGDIVNRFDVDESFEGTRYMSIQSFAPGGTIKLAATGFENTPGSLDAHILFNDESGKVISTPARLGSFVLASSGADYIGMFTGTMFEGENIEVPKDAASYTIVLFNAWTEELSNIKKNVVTFEPDKELGNFEFVLPSNFENTTDIPAELDKLSSPYFSSDLENSNRIKLSAYAFRAYEAIYNAYIRDNRNNPYYVDGKVRYNEWIPTDAGGADTFAYKLHRANWERDFLTTAIQSPQQGEAPLVGLTTYTTKTVSDDGTTKEKLNIALRDEDGRAYSVQFQSNKDGVTGVEYEELDPATATQPLSARSLIDVPNFTQGISIPDFRIVNAYQKFLELNVRKGFSYKEIIQGRFDCKVKYDDLNMPEFIGGVTRDVNMNRVVQSVETGQDYAGALGSLAGDATVFGSTDAEIDCFCDEESLVMGILSVVPVANYSQLLPKHFLYRDLLDHFQPEFDRLGFQPITYGEVCPVEAFAAGDSLTKVFGYQRPWYEYVAKVDTVHGLFRTQLRNFLINRHFADAPALNESFLLVDPEQVNDVFAVKEVTDKILGQVWFDCQVKLPISRVAIPRLD